MLEAANGFPAVNKTPKRKGMRRRTRGMTTPWRPAEREHEFFSQLFCGLDSMFSPNPLLLKALGELDTDGKEIWMIGDTKLDLISAKEAKVNSIGVLSGYDNIKTLEKFTNIIFNDVLEAIDYLKSRKKQHTFFRK
jgi:phosphoglycolate phosphatase-like HAD superfamily hydrolase